MKVTGKEIIDDEILHVSLSEKIFTREDFEALQKLVDTSIEEGILKCAFNCTAVKFISSGGLGAFFQVDKALKEKGGKLSLYGMTGELRQLFTITLLDKKLNVVDNKNASLDFLRG